MRVPISLAALTVLEVGPFDMVRIARNCGYSHVGLRPVAATPTEPHTALLGHRVNCLELRHVLQGEDIAVLDVEIVRLTPKVDWDHMTRVIAFAAEFGAARLLVADNDPDPQRSAVSLARLAEIGEQQGVTPCLEFMPWTHAPDLAAAQARVCGISNAALLIDAFHLARSGGSPGDIPAKHPSVSYLQLCDIAGPIPELDEILREARSDRLFPGEGEVDLSSLITRFPSCPISLEIPADRLRDAGWNAMQRAQLAIDRTARVLDVVHGPA